MSWGLFSKRDFCLSSNATPEKLGPGAYNVPPPDPPIKPSNAPFGSRVPANDVPKPNGVPDPGQYEAKPLDEQPKYIFSSKTKRKIFEDTAKTPAPNSYQQLEDWIKEPPKPTKHKLEPSSRPLTGFVGQDVSGYQEDENGELKPVQIQFKTPNDIGPGSYEAPELKKPTPIYMDRPAERDLYGKFNDVPGPGAYKYNDYQTKMMHEIRQIHREKPPETQAPVYLGPEPWIQEREALTRSCFKSKTERGIFPPGEYVPPPGMYAEENDITTMLKTPISRAQTAFGVRTGRSDFWTPTDTPGPGAYSPKGYKWIKKGQRPGRHAVDRPPPDEGVPGPGSYDWAKDKKTTRPNSVFMTRTKRVLQNDLGKDAPGPGHYTPTFDPTKVPTKFNATKRFKGQDVWISTSCAPPVGCYDPIYDTSSKGRTISRIGHRPLYDKSSTPGPGKYEITHKSFLRHSYNSSIPI